MPLRKFPATSTLLWTAAVICAPLCAQEYPARPVRVVSPVTPGSGADVIARIYAPVLSEKLGKQFIIDNRAGAAGNIGAELVARATPDGYTLLVLNASVASSQSLYKTLAVDVRRDFGAIAMLGTGSYMLVVNTALPVRNVKEFIALGKARQGQLSFASTGNGGTLHLIMEKFRMQAGMTMLHVPYKGTAASIPDLLGGQVNSTFGTTLGMLPHVRSGRIRALGISGSMRSAAAPEVPTIAESGLPGFEALSWFALAAPKATPRAIIMTLNSTVLKIAQTQEIVTALANQGAEIVLMTPEQTDAYIRTELDKWRKVTAAAGVIEE